MATIIETVNLTRYYGRQLGIKDLNLVVSEGEIFGYIGPNGAGKSTTIRLLLGLIRISSGSARVFGRDVEKHREDILAHIGYMQAESNFYSDMRVGELIGYSASLRKKDCTAEAAALMDRFELDPGRKIGELSLGNRRKVNIVCAMQHRPELYILDEPTSGLDPLMQKEFWDLIRERNREGATFLISSHVLSEVQHNCGRAAIIRNGSIVRTDDVAKLTGSMAKKVVAAGVPAGFFLEGMRNVKVNGDVLTFLFRGDINALLAELAGMDIRDLQITEPDLEEIFLHYYERDERP
ncbi:MAG: ABC transporter ATP-binding protein [Bacillota bacterium]|nr:ABC transporter ATP-binding protein [Bacillota bacterium]